MLADISLMASWSAGAMGSMARLNFKKKLHKFLFNSPVFPVFSSFSCFFELLKLGI
jgi:hypothetical protein